MSAVRLARGATGRDLVVKFSGCYHGHVDYLLVAAGSGLATFGQPTSKGVPRELAALTRVLPLDDTAAAEKLFAEDGGRIAAAIIEPVPANNGLLLQRPEFLRSLRRVLRWRKRARGRCGIPFTLPLAGAAPTRPWAQLPGRY